MLSLEGEESPELLFFFAAAAAYVFLCNMFPAMVVWYLAFFVAVM